MPELKGRRQSLINEGIQATEVNADVLAVGHNAQAIKIQHMGQAVKELYDELCSVRNELGVITRLYDTTTSSQAYSRSASEYNDHFKKLILENTRRLRILELRAAQFGNHTPPEIITEIENIRLEIVRLEQIIKAF